MKIAARILEDFEKFEVVESKAHVHALSERACLFRAYALDPATTEREYAEALYALTRMVKPYRALELGTGMGLTSLLIAAAIKENRYGNFRTVDTRYLAPLKILAENYGLSLGVEMMTAEVFIQKEIANKEAGQFDLVFFDTVQADKGVCARAMLKGGLITPNGLLVFHDTSKLRFRDGGNADAINDNYHKHLDEIERCGLFDVQRLDFPYSRGLTVMRAYRSK